jgi:FG-GAP repeat
MAGGHMSRPHAHGRARRVRSSIALATVVLGTSLAAWGAGATSWAAGPASLTEQGPKLTGAGEVGSGAFGFGVAVSGDGSTAIVGGPQDKGSAGAVWVFVRSGDSWVPQGGKITPTGEVGHGYFGISVALSQDGDTALIGSPKDGHGAGAAYVFTRSGQTWTQRARLTGGEEVGKPSFGRRVALSSDGQTALIGAYADNGNAGAAWVFARAGESWAQQGPKLTGPQESGAGQFGGEVALSGDGNTALIGGPTDDGGVGAVWFFGRTEAVWSPEGSKVTVGEESGDAEVGRSVSLSNEGTTAVVSGPSDSGGVGAAWVFTSEDEEWSQSAKLLPGPLKGKGAFGVRAAISGDGETILVGAPKAHTAEGGAAWVFKLQGGEWARQALPLTGGGETKHADFGRGVALSEDGTVALVGGPKDDHGGAAWAYGE